MEALEPAFCGLLPHPPIVVPEVGGNRIEECRQTVDGCREFARRCKRTEPDRLFLVSPHSPRRHGAFGVFGGRRLTGDLGQFGAPGAAVDLPNDPAVAGLLTRSDVPTWTIPPQPLDHGALVPLWFLVDAGWDGPTCVVSLPWESGASDLAAFGRAAARALAEVGGRIAFVASGDMTHRAQPGAPAGFHPRAVEFDQTLTELVAAGRLDAIAGIDRELRRLAAEDAVESSAIAAAAIGFRASGADVISYEHPFGVGYLVAVFHDGSPPTGSAGAIDALPAVAREAIRAKLEGRAPRDLPAATGELARSAPVFVTLRCADGELRGCIGSTRPLTGDLVAETADRACAAAFGDPRFPALQRDELDSLSVEVSILGELERVESTAELDPRRYGVVVSDRDGRSGVLLPGIAGVDAAEQQVAIASRKAGIPEGAAVRLQRFPVQKAQERS